LEYGYTEEEIDDAFSRKYSHPLLGAKPKSADLEGYIYPETYQIEGTSDLTELITRSFDEFYKKLKEEDAIKKLKARNMNLHQAIILASIIQQEVADPKEQKQVSQVFQKRLAMDMALESDATFVYAAKRLGVEPRVGLESPYNTRIHKGLTPGPIANFNFSAIKAVYEPAPGEFIYFVSGDDGITRFSKTPEEHQEKIDKYCKKLCEMF
jgi:UPF0755 protein